MKIVKNRFQRFVQKKCGVCFDGAYATKKMSPDDTSRCSPCTHTPPAAWTAAPRFYILKFFAHKAPCRHVQVAVRPL
jgi:hypothetical protein